MARYSATGGVPNQMGGYNYSTDKSQADLFNQGGETSSPGASAASYDYSAKGRAAAMYRRTGNAPVAVPNSYDYSTAARKTAKLRRINRGLNQD